jgi:hypothetical protein
MPAAVPAVVDTGVAFTVKTMLVATSVLLAHRAMAEPPPSATESAEGTKLPVAGITDAEFKDLKAKLDVHKQPWASISWQVSLTEARELAAKTKRPIFMALGTGNPLGWG